LQRYELFSSHNLDCWYQNPDKDPVWFFFNVDNGTYPGNFSSSQVSMYKTSSGKDSNSLASDPQISTPYTANPVAVDYNIKETSRCKLAGIQIPEITHDYSGSPRAIPPSIGAFE
jgi:hypothetical protein